MAYRRHAIEELVAEVAVGDLRARDHHAAVGLVQQLYTLGEQHLFPDGGGVGLGVTVAVVVAVGRRLLAVQRVLIVVRYLLVAYVSG